ncbi:hypothetical protein C8F04DRAFT_1190494 [Mycena alexandri]|uniref:Uncharacterized protein n=1 Tax=Mycena alexandri TaxID=1745969 RepID=A0AAD6SEE0_9AGAR|nr:hypothetical protein C8F04DRAFT_1190494 [Mycena alexandri]
MAKTKVRKCLEDDSDNSSDSGDETGSKEAQQRRADKVTAIIRRSRYKRIPAHDQARLRDFAKRVDPDDFRENSGRSISHLKATLRRMENNSLRSNEEELWTTAAPGDYSDDDEPTAPEAASTGGVPVRTVKKPMYRKGPREPAGLMTDNVFEAYAREQIVAMGKHAYKFSEMVGNVAGLAEAKHPNVFKVHEAAIAYSSPSDKKYYRQSKDPRAHAGAYDSMVQFLNNRALGGGQLAEITVGLCSFWLKGLMLEAADAQITFHANLLIYIHEPKNIRARHGPGKDLLICDPNFGVASSTPAKRMLGLLLNAQKEQKKQKGSFPRRIWKSKPRGEHNRDGDCLPLTLEWMLEVVINGPEALGIERNEKGEVTEINGFRRVYSGNAVEAGAIVGKQGNEGRVLEKLQRIMQETALAACLEVKQGGKLKKLGGMCKTRRGVFIPVLKKLQGFIHATTLTACLEARQHGKLKKLGGMCKTRRNAKQHGKLKKLGGMCKTRRNGKTFWNERSEVFLPVFKKLQGIIHETTLTACLEAKQHGKLKKLGGMCKTRRNGKTFWNERSEVFLPVFKKLQGIIHETTLTAC